MNSKENMMKLLCLVFVLSLVGCLDKDTTIYKPNPGGSGGGSGDLEAKYDRIKDVLQASCLTSGCHAGGNIVDLGSGERLAASNAKARIENGTMPPPNSGPGQAFDDSKKSKLLSFFN